MDRAGVERLVQRLVAAWEARDLDAFVGCLSDDIEWYDPAMPAPPACGRAAVRAFADAVIRAFPDFRYEVLPPICVAEDGSRCAVLWRISGSHLASLEPPGYAPTGRRAELEGVDLLELEGERVKRILTAFDTLPAAEQLLGLRLRPTPGTWRGFVAVRAQRLAAWLARRRRPSLGTLDSRRGPMPVSNAYREDLSYIHDTAYGGVARDAAKRLLDELARVGHPRGTVVDLGCGSGILARHVGQAGYRVVGVDLSDAMLAVARAQAPNAELRVGSFVSVDLPECVAVAAIGEVLSYGFDAANDDRARADLFRRAYEALVPGGLLLFDVAGPERAEPGSQRTFAQGPDWAVLVETDLEGATGALTRNITTFRQVGTVYRRDAEVHRLTLIDPARALESLRAVGFETQALPSYGASPLPKGVLVFLCRKPVAGAVSRKRR